MTPPWGSSRRRSAAAASSPGPSPGCRALRRGGWSDGTWRWCRWRSSLPETGCDGRPRGGSPPRPGAWRGSSSRRCCRRPRARDWRPVPPRWATGSAWWCGRPRGGCSSMTRAGSAPAVPRGVASPRSSGAWACRASRRSSSRTPTPITSMASPISWNASPWRAWWCRGISSRATPPPSRNCCGLSRRPACRWPRPRGGTNSPSIPPSRSVSSIRRRRPRPPSSRPAATTNRASSSGSRPTVGGCSSPAISRGRRSSASSPPLQGVATFSWPRTTAAPRSSRRACSRPPCRPG